MGIYTVFLDVAMALSSPALGWIAQVSSLRGVYLASALTVLLSIGIAIHLLRTPRTS